MIHRHARVGADDARRGGQGGFRNAAAHATLYRGQPRTGGQNGRPFL
jgi:hypothetical protein